MGNRLKNNDGISVFLATPQKNVLAEDLDWDVSMFAPTTNGAILIRVTGHASGQFGNTGDAQTSVLVCRGTTTSATQTELFLDGASQRMIMPTNSTWAFDILVTGRAAGGNSATYQLLGTAGPEIGRRNRGVAILAHRDGGSCAKLYN